MRVFGYEKSALLGQRIEVLVPEARRAAHERSRTGYQAHPELRPMGRGLPLEARRRDGTTVPVDITLGPFETPSGRYVAAIVRDISDRKAAEEELARQARDLAVKGSLVYVADGAYGLRIIDVSDPAAPVDAGLLDMPDRAIHVRVVGTLAYVADVNAGLHIIDVSSPAFPVEIGAYGRFGTVPSLAVAGDRAYIMASGSGLHIIDVSNPASPVQIGVLRGFHYPRGIEVIGDLAYVADDTYGVRVIDVSNPAAPLEVGGVSEGGVALGVAVVGDLTYVANDTYGLRILDFGPEYTALPEPDALYALVSGALTLALLQRTKRARTRSRPM